MLKLHTLELKDSLPLIIEKSTTGFGPADFTKM
jgi:hypothetical protein